jgi:hypothetical protein
MLFKGINNLEELLKKAEAELLLSSVEINSDGTSLVVPVKCPGIGRKNDFLKDDKGKPACIYNTKRCKYLIDAKFEYDKHIKTINCKAI